MIRWWLRIRQRVLNQPVRDVLALGPFRHKKEAYLDLWYDWKNVRYLQKLRNSTFEFRSRLKYQQHDH